MSLIMPIGFLAAFTVLVLGIFSVISPKLALVLFAAWAVASRAYEVWEQEPPPENLYEPPARPSPTLSAPQKGDER